MPQAAKSITKNESTELEQQITHEAITALYQLVPGKIIEKSIIISIVIAVMWSHITHGVLIAWGLLMYSGFVYQDYRARLFIRQDVPHTQIKKWIRELLFSWLYYGLLWASAVFLFNAPESLGHQVFLITIIINLSTVRIVSAMYYLPLFYVYSAPMMLALVVRFAMEGTPVDLALALLMAWSFLASIMFAKIINKSMRSEKRLRHESHELTEALQLKTVEAQQAMMAKSRFLAAASHDLRQPLHALSLFVDVLKESKSSIERSELFSRIELSLDALRKLFDALLDVSRLDAKVVKPEYSHFDLAELLREQAEEFRPAADKMKLSLKVHAKKAVVVSDRLLLVRIVRNLISNALRYTDSGGILLSARSRGDRVLLQVWDTGIGIPQESQEQIFIEFQQLHNSHRDRTQGLGLGLALVQRLCQLLDHPLSLCSQPGKGSVFSISLPRGSASLLSSKQVAPVSHSWDLNGRRILVIDDEYEILHAMQTLLSKWGCDVITADSLEDALDKLDKSGVVPELILSDLRLRDKRTGIEAMDEVREKFGLSIPGILITGDTDPEQLMIAKQSDYKLLQKPVQPAHLRTVIHHHLSPLLVS